MKHFFTANFTRTAICVVMLSIFPALAIIAATGITRYNEELSSARSRGERFVKAIATRQAQVTEVMETLAQALARLSEVRNADKEAASVLFANLAKKSPEYVNIFLLNNAGTVVASYPLVDSTQNFSGHTFFKRALRRNAFTVGKLADSPFTASPVLYFAMPVPRSDGAPPDVICVSLNLSRYEDVFSGLSLPNDASVYILDGTGALAFGYPQPAPVMPGEMLGGEIWRQAQHAHESNGHFVAKAAGEAEALFVLYQKLFLPNMDQPYFYVLYTRPEQAMYAQAEAVLHRDIFVFCVVALLSLAAALLLCHFSVRRPWDALLSAATKVGNGDLSTRVDGSGVGGEIGMLDTEFNAMAQALDKRDKELSAALEYAELSRNAKGEFLANMSHEIRTSMNAILGMAYLVLKTELTPQQKGYISKLLAAANSLLRVINDILDFSKIEAGKLTMEDIAFSLRRILSNLRSECAARLNEKRLSFELRTDQAVPDYLLGDPLRLSQALMVLLDDAVTRSERGVVAFSCSLVELDLEQVTLSFCVRDAGVGFTPSQLAEIRELFSREEDTGPSTMDKTRLRLAIANRLFRMMGGAVEVSSIFGEGVVFTATARFGYAVGEMCAPEKLFDGKKALIVDGSAVSRQDLAEVLPRFGFEVVCVENLDSARTSLCKAEDAERPFAVVFVDWKPSVPGLLAQVTHLKNDPGLKGAVPIILTTAAGRAELPASLEELSIDALLPKPINESLVFDTLMNVLGVQKTMNGVLEAGNNDETNKEGLKGLRILLAEDNSVNQQIAAEILGAEGIELVITGNGEEAVAALENSPPNTFDLVLMDLQMPKMDGFTATRVLRAKMQFHILRLPIIAMTAHSDINEISECFAAGMNDHTGKPIVVDRLFATLRRWLPVEHSAGEVLASGTARLRSLIGKADADITGDIDPVLEEFRPFLHSGRVDLIRALLTEGGPEAVEDILRTLESMAHELLNKDKSS